MKRTQLLGVAALVLPLIHGVASATDVDEGWEAFIIRNATVSGLPPIIQNNSTYVSGAVEFVPFEAGQKAGLGTDLISGQPVKRIHTLHVDRLGDVEASGALYGPYFNIWITDGLGHYAVIANEPSNPEWAGSRWDVPSWDFLKTKTCKVYETSGAGSNTSWVHVYAGETSLTFEDVGDLTIEAPPAAYILDPANAVGSGAPDVLGTNQAWGYNWIFGDTVNNYVITGEGYVVDNYTLSLQQVENVTQGTYHPTLQAAIAAAVDGDTIQLLPGTYVESGQIVIDKDLTILGDASDPPVVMTDQNTGNSGNSRGWWLVTTDGSLNLSNVVLDGSGFLVDRAIFAFGPGSLVDCELRHIGYNPSGPNYAGRGIVFWDAPWTITGNSLSDIGRIGIYGYGPGTAGTVIQGNHYQGKGDGNWLDYGIELEGGATATITGNTIMGCTGVASVDGSGSAGMLMTTYFAPGTGATLTNNTVTGNSVGVYIGYNASDATTVVAHGNNFADNADAGMINTGTVRTNATGNWWGHASGPEHPDNPGGMGVVAEGDIDFGAWLTSIYNITQSLDVDWIALDTPGMPTQSVLTVSCVPTGTAWRGVNVTLTYDPDVLELADFDFVFDNDVDVPIMYWTESTPGVIDASVTLPGITDGQTLPADLFTATFDGIAEGDTPVHIEAALVRNLANQPITPVSLGGDVTLTVDGTSPVMAITTNPTGGGVECLNPAPLVYSLLATDNVGVGETQVQVTDAGGAHGWTTIHTGISTPTRTPSYPDSWTFNPALYLDGLITVSFRCIDGVNFTSTVVSDQFELDRVAPTAPASLDADPAFHACDLSWTAPGDQTGYTLYWKKRAGYPYSTGLPGAWNGVGAGDGNVAIHPDSLTKWFATDNTYAARGVYDFTLAATDCAGNTTRSAVFSATNYFLGDVTGASTYDGKVESYDLTVIAAVYGSVPTTDPGREMNVGPTHNSSNYGLPAYGVTNALVNFEDLIIFAMNYGPTGPQLPVDRSVPAGPASLALAANGEAFTLTLDGNLKGFSARVSCEAALLEARADFPVFFYRDGDAWLVDAVSLGGNLPTGSTVTLRFAEGGQPSLVAVDGRDAANRPVPVTALGGALPERFALEQNFPNPFNPVTTIRYALPETAQVRLTLFNALGQQVMSLDEGERTAGLHELRLDGSPLASGVYIYRLEAGRFADQKKLVLVK